MSTPTRSTHDPVRPEVAARTDAGAPHGGTDDALLLPPAARRVATAMSVLAGVLLLALVVLTVADVVSRNLRDASILGTVDISTMLLVAVAFLGLAAAELEGRHVSVELIEMHLRPGARAALSVVRIVLLGALGLLLAWGLTEVFASAMERGETTNDILRLPTWPAKLVLLVSFIAFFIAAVWKEALQLRSLRARKGGDR